MLFDPHAGAADALRNMTRPSGRRLRRSTAAWPTTVGRDGTTVPLVPVKAFQPDDRPLQPKFGGEWIEVRQTRATARRNESPKFWDAVVAGFDEGSPKAAVTHRMGVRPPVVRSFTGGKADQPGAANVRADQMRRHVDEQYLLLQGKQARKGGRA